MYFVKYENPEGEHLKVAKAEAPPQTPPYLATPGASGRNGLMPTVGAVSLARKAQHLDFTIVGVPASTPKAWRRRVCSM